MKFSEQKCPRCREVDYKVLHKYAPNIDGEVYWHVVCTFRMCGYHYGILAEVKPVEQKAENTLLSKA